MQIWTTTDQPEPDQFSYWREVICQAYIALDSIRPSSGSFVGKVTAHPLSAVNVTTITSTRQKVSRGRSEISRMPAEVYFLNLQTRGQCRMSQGNRAALLGAGEFSVVDSTKPYLVDYCSDDWEQYSFRIPRHLLSPFLHQPNQSTAIKVASNGGIGTVVIDYLMSIARNAEGLSHSADKVSSSMIELVAMSLGATENAREAGRGAALKALCSSLIHHVDMNIADPELSPLKVAAHFGVSPRYLHKAFEEGGQSFGRVLLERRLDRCAKDLTTTSAVSISEIALRWGFNDISHFSRTFRQKFGKSPREFRHEGTKGGLILDVSSA